MTPVQELWYFVTWFRSQHSARFLNYDEEMWCRLYLGGDLDFHYKRSFDTWFTRLRK